MIEINLISEELRPRIQSKASSLPLFNTKIVFYLLPLVVIVFIIMHIYYASTILSKNKKLTSLNAQWHSLADKRKLLEEFNKEQSGLSQGAVNLNKLSEERILWSEKLSKLSSYLSSRMWFNEIAVGNHKFTLKGSIVSLRSDELSLVNAFINELKSDQAFIKDFKDLELTSIQKKPIASYDVAEFILEGRLKTGI